MKYVSLFAGIGGFDYALNQLGHECVYANDFDKYCKIIYDKNFSTEQNYTIGESVFNGGNSTNASSTDRRKLKGVSLDTRSLTEVPASSIPDHDLLVGGFPCQSFSIAGKRGGFDDTRGTLFFDIARIIKEKRTKYLILENVKGLLSHDSGRTFKTILSTLTELGYDIQTMVLNSKNFGVPQNRERVFIVGHLRGLSRPKIFPIQGSDRKDQEQVTSTAIDSNYGKGIDHHGQRTMIYWKNSKSKWVKEDRTYTPILKTQSDYVRQPLLDGSLIRRLTPVECERLQGFPDNWTEGVSDTQRYKMCGNAVTVNVVYEVARRMFA